MKPLISVVLFHFFLFNSVSTWAQFSYHSRKKQKTEVSKADFKLNKSLLDKVDGDTSEARDILANYLEEFEHEEKEILKKYLIKTEPKFLEIQEGLQKLDRKIETIKKDSSTLTKDVGIINKKISELKLKLTSAADSEKAEINKEIENFEREIKEIKNKQKKLIKKRKNLIKRKSKYLDGRSNRNYLIYWLHINQDTIQEYSKADYSHNFTTDRSITPQALSGLNLINNALGDESSGAVELGARINNTRISLPTVFKYKVDEDKFSIKRVQKDRYLYFDFISRGIITLDSIQNSMSEYVNTTQGSPLSLRLNFQRRLTPAYLDIDVVGRREPVFYFTAEIDARLIPVTSKVKIEDAGGSFHFMPSIVAILPSGQIDSPEQEDNFIVQLTFNTAYLTNNLRNAMTPDKRDSPFLNESIAMSFEARLGNYSTANTLRNWSIFAKYTWQNIIGSNFTFGFTFAPQGEKDN